jgi:cyanophycin synthetase
VKEGGTLVLNADDERLAHLLENERVKKIPKTAVYFAIDENNEVVRRHLQAGGKAYFARGNALIESVGEIHRTIADVSMLPIVMNGAAKFQIGNLLAAIAACRAFGIEQDVLLKSLVSFSSWANNPGRANLYRLNGGHVMVDYGHNTEAFDAICGLTSTWNDRRVTGIITIPGDRDDSIIDRAARVAARGFNKVIVREDHDLRGRKQGDIAKIVCRAIEEVSPGTECEVVLDEIEALRTAVRQMIKGEVIVLFYEKLLPIQKALQEMAAQPVMSLPPLSPAPPQGSERLVRPVVRPRRIDKRLVPAPHSFA